jgi:hypothetical protein
VLSYHHPHFWAIKMWYRYHVPTDMVMVSIGTKLVLLYYPQEYLFISVPLRTAQTGKGEFWCNGMMHEHDPSFWQKYSGEYWWYTYSHDFSTKPTVHKASSLVECIVWRSTTLLKWNTQPKKWATHLYFAATCWLCVYRYSHQTYLSHKGKAQTGKGEFWSNGMMHEHDPTCSCWKDRPIQSYAYY